MADFALLIGGMKPYRALFWTAALLSIAWAAGGQPELEPTRLQFATGRPGGHYFDWARRLQEHLSARGSPHQVDVVGTAGSYANVDRLVDGSADLALVQGDVAYVKHFRYPKFLALEPVGLEVVHVAARRELGIERLSDLLELPDRIWRISVGEEESGTYAHARIVLRHLGLRDERIDKKFLRLQSAVEAVNARQLDLFFHTSATPISALERAAERGSISLVEIDQDIVEMATRRHTFLLSAEIPYRDYAGMRRNVRTLAARALWVAHADLPDPVVRDLLQAFHDMENIGPDADLAELEELSIPVHPASVGFHQPQGIWPRVLHQKWLLVFMLLVGLFMVLRRFSRVAYFIHQFEIGRLVVAVVFVWLLGALCMHWIEGEQNSNFRSFGDSSVAILHYLFSGLETRFPATNLGNVVAILVLILGMALVTVFTATLGKVMVAHALNVRHLRSKPSPFVKLRDHVVIFGWSRRTERLIQELRRDDLPKKPTIVVVTRDLRNTRVQRSRTFRGVWGVQGDKASREVLEKADMDQARCAVVLEGGGHEPAKDDACCGHDMVATVRAVERTAPSTHTLVEALSKKGVDDLQNAGADEIVDVTTWTDRLLAQALVTRGLIPVYRELVSFGKGSQEIYRAPVPDELEGLTFRELAHHLLGLELIPVGFVASKASRPRDFQLNPRRRDASGQQKLTDHDVLFVADHRKALHGTRWRTLREPTKHEKGSEMTRPSVATKQPSKKELRRIAICGWNEEAREILRQLRSPVILRNHEFSTTVIARPGAQLEAEGSAERLLSHVSFVAGDPTRKEVLKNVGLENLETLVILADKTGASGSATDHRSLVIALAARAVAPDIRILVEVLDSAHQEHFEGIDNIEIISVHSFAEKILSQAVLCPGITGIFMQLLTADEDTNEIYLTRIPEPWIGRSFEDCYKDQLEAPEEVLLLGYQTQAEYAEQPEDRQKPVQILNPGLNRDRRNGAEDWRGHELQEEDRLILMAYEEPSWEWLKEASEPETKPGNTQNMQVAS